jgi:hypothetical protein
MDLISKRRIVFFENLTNIVAWKIKAKFQYMFYPSDLSRACLKFQLDSVIYKFLANSFQQGKHLIRQLIFLDWAFPKNYITIWQIFDF